MNDLVSICIPTFERPELLAIALESCAIQDYRPLELVIGDDSRDERSAEVVESVRSRREWNVLYRHHSPSLGQNANVAELFQRANGDRIVLLHDDDVLLPGAVAALAAPWALHPDLAVAFGKQEIISHDGSVDAAATEKLNNDFRRSGNAGLLGSSMRAALLQQMPNDGYMIRADIAREVGYRSDAEVGIQCDLDFTLRLGAALGSNRMYLVENAVSQYRLTAGSVSTAPASRKSEHPRSATALLETIESLHVPASLQPERRQLMHRFVEIMVKGYAISGDRQKALRLFLSEAYGWRRRVSPKGLYHLLLIIDPRLDRMRSYG